MIILNLVIIMVIILICFIIKRQKAKKYKSKTKNSKWLQFLKKMICIDDELNEMKSRNIIKWETKILNTTTIVYMSLFLFTTIFLIINYLIKMPVTAIILSLPMLISLKLIIKMTIMNEKKRIMRTLPAYIVNLKNHVEQNNNILEAIKETNCAEPLNKYINNFNSVVNKGLNIITAFESLKQDVNLKVFSDLIVAFQTCYLNGGDFSKMLEKFIVNISKEISQAEKIKEDAYSSVIILGILLVINIYLVFGFTFNNLEYSLIIKESLVGNIIINFNALSYIFIGYLVLKIYRTGE